MSNVDPTAHAKWPLWVAVVVGLIWLPSLVRGFCEDDFLLVPVTFSQFVENPLWGAGAPAPVREGFPVYRGEGRPVSTFTFALLPPHALVLLAALESRVPFKLALIGLGSGAKPPLFFQNFVFAHQFIREGRRAAAAITLLWLILFGAGIYWTRYTEEAAFFDSLYTRFDTTANTEAR